MSDLPADPAALEAHLVGLARAHALSVVQTQEARYETDPRFYFDSGKADKAVNFFPTFLRHSKGRHAGKPFHLDPVQAAIVRIMFGYRWKPGFGEEPGMRVVRVLWLEVARKNGKSTFLAGLALLLLVADGEASPEVLSAATDRDQASIIFREAAAMVQQSPKLDARQGGVLEVMKGAIICPRLMGAYRVLSGVPEGKHGLNPSGIIVDEVHEQKSRELIDTLHTATGARMQPLEAYATTAGYDRKSICFEMHEIAGKVAAGELDDPSFLPIIFAANDNDDFTDPRTLVKANPLLGSAVRLSYLLDQIKRARETPGYTNTFRRLHLNQWTEQSSRWLDMQAWGECRGDLSWRQLEEELAGRRCYGGLDLARVRDFSAFTLVFPPTEDDPKWRVLCRFWLPEENFRARMKETRVRLDLWRNDGAIFVTAGNTTDFDFIGARILEDAGKFDIVQIGLDRTFAGELKQKLMNEGLEIIEVGQGFLSMAAPTAELERQVVSRDLAHGDHPVLTWMASNVAVKMDPAGNLKPDKERSGDKIDGIVAQCNALFLALLAAPAKGKSFWDDDQFLADWAA